MSDRRNATEAPLEPDMLAEWDQALQNMNLTGRDRLRQLGITLEAECRVGFVGWDRIATAGRTYFPMPGGTPALIVGAWVSDEPGPYAADPDFVLADLIAFQSAEPDRWFYRRGDPFAVLGWRHLHLAHEHGRPVTLHRNPLEWLQHEGRGAVLLEWAEHCLHAPEVAA
jgi:hypothetical protein